MVTFLRYGSTVTAVGGQAACFKFWGMKRPRQVRVNREIGTHDILKEEKLKVNPERY